MLELLIDFIWVVFDVPRYTGKFLVFIFTFGRVHCEDGAATIIGYTFWFTVLIAVVTLALVSN